jgi:large subunit ribosomal protein L22
MEARAINRFVGTSPRKMRLVVDLIRGRGVEEALSVLHFTPKHAAKDAEMVLRSAISNIQSKDEGGRIDPSTLFVKEAFVNGGPTVKRISPAPMGRAYRIRKRSHHLTIVVAQREAKVKPKPAVPKAAAAEAPVAKPTAAEKPKKKATTKSTKSEKKSASKKS